MTTSTECYLELKIKTKYPSVTIQYSHIMTVDSQNHLHNHTSSLPPSYQMQTCACKHGMFSTHRKIFLCSHTWNNHVHSYDNRLSIQHSHIATKLQPCMITKYLGESLSVFTFKRQQCIARSSQHTVQRENLAGIKFGEMAKKRLYFDIGEI